MMQKINNNDSLLGNDLLKQFTKSLVSAIGKPFLDTLK